MSKFSPAPPALTHGSQVISMQPQYYHGWPTVARLRDGRLLLVCSGGRQKHICPFGRVELMVSHDEGTSWSFPRTVLDTELDDRDAGVLESAQGTLLITSFTSLDYERFLVLAEAGEPNPMVTPETLPLWKAARDRLSPEQRKARLGEWIIRSTDGGLSWSPPIPTVVNSPHGPISLRDGRLLYLGKELWTKDRRVGAAESTDDGLTWHWLAQIPSRPGDDATACYHELHAVECDNGTIVAHIRIEGKIRNAGETLQTESTDGGRTWSEPHTIGVWGQPSHLLKLRDGRLVMTCGYRREPFGNRARISADHGQTWSEFIVISGDGAGTDLGYPSTVQLTNGSLLTVWYELRKSAENWNVLMQGETHAALRQARWQLMA